MPLITIDLPLNAPMPRKRASSRNGNKRNTPTPASLAVSPANSPEAALGEFSIDHSAQLPTSSCTESLERSAQESGIAAARAHETASNDTGSSAANASTTPSNTTPSKIREAKKPLSSKELALEESRLDTLLREQVAIAIGSHRYALWFENGTSLRLRAACVEVTAANSYVCDWITRHFRQTLLTTACALLGVEATCSVTVDAGVIAQTPSSAVASARGGSKLVSQDAPNGSSNSPHATSVASTANQSVDGAVSANTADTRRRSTAPARASRVASLRRLEDFVVGESNRLAHAASQQIGDGAPESPAILFIHGECGVGKTHLIQGLCRRRSERAPNHVIKYVTAEQFTNEYIAAVREGSLEAFRKSLRRVDLLAIDDIHFFANKTATQAEFLHTIDAIDLSGARVALVSDEHPRHIRRFNQSLVSRFLSGMVVKVERPDRATRVALVQRLARERGLDMTTAAEDAVAGRCAGSIREIEGAITRLGALVELDGVRGQIGPGTVERLLGQEAAAANGSAPIRLGAILEAVCERLRVSREDLLGSGRHARTVVARGVVAHLARELTTHSYPEIARALGRDTHSAVHTAAKRLKGMIEVDARIAQSAEPIREVVDQLRHDLARRKNAVNA